MAYKTGWLKKVINGVSTKIFSFAHVKTVYTDYENGKLLSDKLTEIDDDIAEINSNLVTKQHFDKLHGYLINVENKFYYDGDTESITFKVKKGSKYTLTTNGDRNNVGFSANYPSDGNPLSNVTLQTNEVIAPIDGYCIWYVNSTLNNTISCSVETNNVGGVASEIVNVNESLSDIVSNVVYTTRDYTSFKGDILLSGNRIKIKGEIIPTKDCEPWWGIMSIPFSAVLDKRLESNQFYIDNDANGIYCSAKLTANTSYSIDMEFKVNVTLNNRYLSLQNSILDRIEGISTTEQIVGTFLGKNLYRNTVVLNFSTPFTVASGNNDTCITSSTGMESQASSYEGSIPWGSIDTLVNAESFVETSSYRFTNPFIFKKDKTGYWYCRNTYGETIAATQIVLTLYYTKY